MPKTTSTARFADRVFDLSEPGVRNAVRDDPDGVLATALTGTVLIDEWQEAPEILGAVKRIVDRDSTVRPGRFIITGSVRAAHQAQTWPGTGRLIRVRMFGLTQAELALQHTYNPIDAFFSPEAPNYGPSDVSRGDYLDRLIAGRFPAVLHLKGRNRSRWFHSYIEQLIDRDAQQVADRRIRPAKLRAVFGSSVARTAQELNKNRTAEDAGVDYRSADFYMQLLEDLSVVMRIPAWDTKRLKRLTQTPKVHVTDAGVAAHELRIDAAGLTSDATLVGKLVETFVAAELAAHLETCADDTAIFHFRNRDGKEVDLVLERNNRVTAIEVKSATSVDRSDAQGLIWMRDKIGASFHLGIVLYTGTLPYQLDDRIWALPISTLWEPPIGQHTAQSPTRSSRP